MTGGARSYEAQFTQQYQNIGGSAKADSKVVTFSNGKLRGDTITFAIDDGTKRDFTGKVNGNRMEGTVKTGGAESKFTATRVEAK